MELKYIKKENDNYKTVNDVLINVFNLSNRLRTKLVNNKCVLLNGSICDTRSTIKYGNIIKINLNYEEDSSNIAPTKMNLDIVYEDEWLLVVNKPAGIAIHPSQLHYEDSLSNGIKYYFDSIGLKKKIRPVNRLDKNTSGLVIFAKCEYIQECLIKQMETKLFKKEYLALVYGKLDSKKGTINLPIARKENSIIERCIAEHGQKSITHYEVLKEFDDYSLVKCILETGRTHQIRVHMKAIVHPLLGDDLYGGQNNLITRQALHCSYLEFVHPISKQIITFKAEAPKDMSQYF